MTDVKLQCNCGAVKGVATGVSPSAGTRIVCHCRDCQQFAHYLDNGPNILDEFGGTDIYQIPIAYVKISNGVEHVRCVRLKPKGLFRWYTECCKTPLGNTMSAKSPFIGIIHNFMDDEGRRDENIGPIRGYTFATESAPEDRRQSSLIKIIARVMYKMAIWKVRGLNKPSAFFDSSGSPIVKPTVLRNTHSG